MKITEGPVSYASYHKYGRNHGLSPLAKCQHYDLAKISTGENNHVYSIYELFTATIHKKLKTYNLFIQENKYIFLFKFVLSFNGGQFMKQSTEQLNSMCLLASRIISHWAGCENFLLLNEP